VVDATGRIIREAKVASEPEALVDFFRRLGLPLTRVGLEAGPLSQWLHAGLAEAGCEAVLLETRHVKATLSAPRQPHARLAPFGSDDRRCRSWS
jgi:transposase